VGIVANNGILFSASSLKVLLRSLCRAVFRSVVLTRLLWVVLCCVSVQAAHFIELCCHVRDITLLLYAKHHWLHDRQEIRE
jgi:hypothetical protein